MKTTLEEVKEIMRAEFLDGFSNSDDRLNGMLGWDSGHKACAESYEKKLAEKDVAMHHLVTAYQSAEQQLSEANARNAMLVDAIESRITADKYCRLYSHLTEAQEAFAHASQDADELMQQAITASSEAVAAWEAEKLREDRLYLARCFREDDRGILASAEQIAQMLEGMANDVKKV